MQKRLAPFRCMPVQGFHHTVRPVKLLLCIRCFRYSIRINKHHISRRKPDFIVTVSGILHSGQHESMLILEQLELPTCPFQYRILMSCIGSRHQSGRQIQDAKPYGYEHFLFIVFT